MSDLARVRMTVGGNTITRNVGRLYAEARGMTVLAETTHNLDGSLRSEERTSARSGRPAKKKTTASSEVGKKKAAVNEPAQPKEEF